MKYFSKVTVWRQILDILIHFIVPNPMNDLFTNPCTGKNHANINQRKKKLTLFKSRESLASFY